MRSERDCARRKGAIVSFPPLKDPMEDAEDKGRRDGLDGPPDSSRPEPHAAPAPQAPQASQSTPAPQPGPPAPPAEPPRSADHELDDDDLEELNEQVDLDDLDILVDLNDLDDLDDLDEPGQRVEPTAPNAPVPAGIRTDKARIAGDEPIPMLTEVVQVPRYDTEDLPQSFADVDWGDLSQRVRENVLERLLRRSDALLDAQLQNTLTPVLERAAETIAHELHDALNRMIRDIVARAVTEELTRLHAEIARRNRSSRPS